MKKIIAVFAMGAAVAVFSSAAQAATPDQKAALKAATLVAEADYKISKAKCDALTGNPGEVCVAAAKAQQVRAESEAKVRYDDSLDTRTSARKAIAEAEFDLSRATCNSQNGNEKDVCIKKADAARIAAAADAKADKKVMNALSDARSDKVKSQYKVALEQCDSFAGKTRDSCVADAKAKFTQ